MPDLPPQHGFIRALKIFIFTAIFVAPLLLPLNVQAESRMAGNTPTVEAVADKAEEDGIPPLPPKKSDVLDETNTPPPGNDGTAKVAGAEEKETNEEDDEEELKTDRNAQGATIVKKPDYELIESFGVLHTSAEGALGIDLWDKTSYDVLRGLLMSLPDHTPYPTMNKLLVRSLLTTADARLLVQRRAPAPGKDLLTLRLKALLDMGDYKNAATLYKANADLPYHEDTARTGILALLGSGQLSLACLETLTLYDYFKTLDFWNDLYGFCNEFFDYGSEETVKIEDIRSQIIRKILKSPYFRYTITSLENLQGLSTLERLLLLTANRYDFSRLSVKSTEDLDPALASLLLQDKNLPGPLRYKFLLYLLDLGFAGTADLAAFYDSVNAPAIKTFAKLANSGTDEPDEDMLKDKDQTHPAASGNRPQPSPEDNFNPDNIMERGANAVPVEEPVWKFYATLYQARADEIPATKIAKLLFTLDHNTDRRETLTALRPFGEILTSADPAAFEDTMIRPALKIMLLDSRRIPEKWLTLWKTFSEKTAKDSLLSLAILASPNPYPKFQNIFSENKISNLPDDDRGIAAIVYEKLDKNIQMSDYDVARVYEKQMILTFEDDYGIPSIDLMEYLQSAIKNRRLGEIVLLSATMFQEAPLKKETSGILNEILKGFNDVGLTTESRALSKDIILGLIRN